jgi:hypothetical protein
MKRTIGAALILVAGAAWLPAQSFEQKVDRGGTKSRGETTALPDKPNTIRGEKVDVSGAAVTVSRSGVNAINPAAGPQHGDGKDNVSRNVVTDEASGLKFLAWEF